MVIDFSISFMVLMFWREDGYDVVVIVVGKENGD